MTVELWGLRTDHELVTIDGDFEPTDVEEKVATFDNKEMAQKYVAASLLKAAKDMNFYPDMWRSKYRYRSNSVLRYYSSYEIRFTEPEDVWIPPHNPEIKENKMTVNQKRKARSKEIDKKGH